MRLALCSLHVDGVGGADATGTDTDADGAVGVQHFPASNLTFSNSAILASWLANLVKRIHQTKFNRFFMSTSQARNINQSGNLS